jgi:hypothetical protein
MLRKGFNVFISILLLLPLLGGQVESLKPVNHASPSFQKTCDMDDCNPNMPKCPLCPPFSSTHLYLYRDGAVGLPTLTSSYVELAVSSLSDQGFVKPIFRPPMITS